MILNSPYVSGSLTVTGNIIASGSITLSGSVASASYADTASFVALAQSASNAVSAQTASFANTLTVAGNLTAQTLVVQTITSSIDFVTGSTRFGSILGNTHVFSGSVTMNPGGLFVSSSGNIGIGTSTPTAKLDVNVGLNSLKISGRDTYVDSTEDPTNANIYVTQAGVGDFGQLAGNLVLQARTQGTVYRDIIFAGGLSNGDALMTILGEGNVGIGTTTPGQLFEVVGGEIKAGRVDSSNEGGQVSFGRSTDNATAWYIDAYGNVASPQLRFVNVTNAVVAMTITGSNVGIGVNNPNSILQVGSAQSLAIIRSTTTTNYAELQIENTTNYLQIGVEGATGNRMGGTIAYNAYLGSYSNYGMTFHTNNLNRMTITNGGNVGMATTSPAALLTLKGRGGADIIFQMNDESNIRRCFYIPNQYYGYMWAVGVVSNGGKAFSLGNQDGNEVGTIVINAGGVAYNTTSDYRLKEDLRDFNGLDKVSKIKVYDFKWKNLDERIDGVIAHELQEVLPYAVSGVKDALNHEGKIEAQSVDYSKLTPVLVKAIQELKAQNDDLQSQINELKAQ
jgi:hypothetical protein